MRVTRHAEEALVALTGRLPMPASVIVNRLRQMDPPAGSQALMVASIAMWAGDLNPKGDKNQWPSNGDMVVVIVKEGAAITAMLRRSWNQPFTPAAFKPPVDEVVRWAWDADRKEWTA